MNAARLNRPAWRKHGPWWARRALGFGWDSTAPLRQLAATPRDYVEAWRVAVWTTTLCAVAGLLGVPHPSWSRRRATALTRLVAALMARSRVRVRNLVYYVDTRRSELYTFQEVYEMGVYDRVPNFLPRSDWLVVDVGANIGVFASRAAMLGARVRAFEPNHGPYTRLLQTMRANGLQVTARPVAVGARRGWARLTGDEVSTTTGAIALTGAGLPVPVVTLDEELADVPHVDLLKIDTEGGEADVLRGATRVLRRTARIVAEYHSETLLAEIRALLIAQGFNEVAAFEDGETGIMYAERFAL